MPSKPSDSFKHPGKPKAGKSRAAGVAYNPNQVLAAAAQVDVVATLDRPRPAKTRYPISLEQFAALESKAAKAKAGATKGATLVPDKSST